MITINEFISLLKDYPEMYYVKINGEYITKDNFYTNETNICIDTKNKCKDCDDVCIDRNEVHCKCDECIYN